MTLDEIVLHDFCAYAGDNTIRLTPEPDRPVVLFTGLNGAGKTTILDALQLCLFGAAAQCAGRAGGPYHDYLERAIHRGSRYGQASVGLVFRRFAEGKEARYRVTRSWKKSRTGVKEDLEVTVDRISAPSVARNWDAHVGQIMPASLAHLFFFDGERAAQYASPESARELVQTGIYSLLGVNIVEQAVLDLRTLERRRQAEKLPEEDRVAIDERRAEAEELGRKIAALTLQSAEIRSRRIDAGGRKLEKLQEDYRNLGGDLRDRAGPIKRRRDRVRRCCEAVKERMRILAEGRLPLLLVPDLLSWMTKRHQQEGASRRAALLADVLEERDRKMIETLPETNWKAQAAAALKKFSADDLARRRADAQTDVLMDMDDSAAAVATMLTEGGLQDAARQMDALLAKWKKWSARLEDMENELHSIPEEDVFAANLRAQEELDRDIKSAEEEVGSLEQEEKQARDRCDKLGDEIREIEEQNILARAARKDKDRFLECSAKTRSNLEAFREKVVRRHISRIEDMVLESYLALMRKQALVGGLSIDPEDFRLTLYSPSRSPIPAEQLSKGEQQLLTVALLWGMARASGKSLPMAIDTPLGRLDSGHRDRLVERYFGCASHQVLLFSTDEEIVGECLGKLAPSISRNYQLSYDDSKGVTSVRELGGGGDCEQLGCYPPFLRSQVAAVAGEVPDRNSAVEYLMSLGAVHFFGRRQAAGRRRVSGRQQRRNDMADVCGRRRRGTVSRIAEGVLHSQRHSPVRRRSRPPVSNAPASGHQLSGVAEYARHGFPVRFGEAEWRCMERKRIGGWWRQGGDFAKKESASSEFGGLKLS